MAVIVVYVFNFLALQYFLYQIEAEVENTADV